MRNALKIYLTVIVLCVLALAHPLFAQDHGSGHGTAPENGKSMDPADTHKHHDMSPATQTPSEDESLDPAARVRVEEKLGALIDKGATFLDENGNKVTMGEFLDKPLVLLPIYFFCPTVCSFLQADLVKVINEIAPVPGQDFNLVTLSFSHDETPDHAREAKKNYVQALTKEFPRKDWHYLVGTRENIQRLTDSLGFHFMRREKHLYVHPNVLIILARDGKITRYVYGPNFLPFDVAMALTEADQGKTGISIKRGVMSFCFNYDPDKKTYVFNIFRVAGSLILVFLLGLVLFLVFGPGKNRK